ncbi:hypothetical protein HYG77_17785 [Rhodococcus sp. ZPP]|uniref:hypothetical protein n=1 Tax=Rhodococcus sp. ZPP TaxID=2749906 RepID=UPI001AD85DB6|nr:hypothetical protein [Rhodococcus sp. ZPP]QTJ67243.1 hypothetical protein HYG77_17785 [Rhodococcus sp. ZPP]
MHNIYLEHDPADRARLAFTVVNASRSLTDRLVSIKSAAAAVNILAPPAALTLHRERHWPPGSRSSS